MTKPTTLKEAIDKVTFALIGCLGTADNKERIALEDALYDWSILFPETYDALIADEGAAGEMLRNMETSVDNSRGPDQSAYDFRKDD